MKQPELMQKMEDWVDQLIRKEEHLSHSSFSAFLKSPLHFVHYKFGEKEKTKAKTFGSLFDMFLLEPGKLKRKYLFYDKSKCPLPKNRMNKKENAEWLDNLKKQAEEEKKILIEQSDIEQSNGMAESVKNSVPAMALLNMCDTTQEFMNFEWEGFLWKGAKDKSCSELTLDLKTADKSDPRSVKRSIYDYGYHRQGFLYNTADGDKYKPYFILSVEKKKPYAVSINHLTDTMLDRAENQLQRGLERFRECLIDPTLFFKGYEFWANKTHGIFEVA